MTAGDDIAGDRLAVLLDGVVVGELIRSYEGSSFELRPEYWELANRPVLGQVFEDAPLANYWVRQGVPPWFANLLPEGPLRELVAKRAGVNPAREYFLLSVLGADLPGAVVIAPSEDSELPINEKEIIEAAEDAEGAELKFSLAGIQLKFSALRDDRGLTIPVHGVGGDWIVKLPDQRYPSVPENEHTMLTWAAASGIDVPQLDLVQVSAIHGLPREIHNLGGVALAVRRFDRAENDERVHIEDFAQVLNLPPREKCGSANYETLARVINAACPPGDLDEYIRRVVFIVLCGNGDAHLKNWSIAYPNGRNPVLAPAYDLVCTVAYISDDQLGLNLAGNKSFDRVNQEAFKRFAQRARIDVARVLDVVREQVSRTTQAWEAVRLEASVPEFVRKTIDKRLGELTLVQSVERGGRPIVP